MFGTIVLMFEAIHDELTATSLASCSRDELRAMLAAFHRVETHAAERRLAVMGALERLEDDGISASAEARSVIHRSRRAAANDVETAAALGSLPAAADALAAGRITLEHAERLAQLIDETAAEQVAELIPLAEQTPADLFRQKSNRWLADKRSRERVEARHRRQRAERELDLWFERNDTVNGALLIHGRLDNATGRAFQSALQAMVDRLWRADGGREAKPTELRTPGQRRIDALVQLVTEPSEVDAPLAVRNMLHLIATVRADGTPDPVEFLDGQPVPQSFLDSLDPTTIDAVGHVFSGCGKPLWTGRRHRLATVHQWSMLIARDRGCTDCGADPAFTQAHHGNIEWEHGGLTDIDNLELKCHTDHALAHHGSAHGRRPTRHRRPEAA